MKRTNYVQINKNALDISWVTYAKNNRGGLLKKRKKTASKVRGKTKCRTKRKIDKADSSKTGIFKKAVI